MPNLNAYKNISKVKIMNIVEDGEDDCYDLEVPTYHNFFLTNGILAHNCVNYAFATQDLLSIPERIIRQCRFIMIPWNIDYQVMKDAFKVANLQEAEVKAQQYNELRRLTSRMKPRDWIVIDANQKTFEFITPLAPITNVRETSN